MSRPWFPFYVGDYTRDTARLTTEAHGAYLLLMLDYWVNGAPPDDDETLATITKLPVAIWRKRRPILAKFFKLENGVWTHTRIEKEKVKAETVGSANSDKAREAAERRWAADREKKLREQSEQCSVDAPSINGALPHNAQSPSPSHLPLRGRESAPAKIASQGLGNQIDPAFQPLPEAIERCHEQGATDAEIDSEVRKFVATQQAKQAFSANWDASWAKWWENWKPHKDKHAAKSKAPVDPSAPVDWDTVLSMFKKLGKWSRHAGPDLDSPACKAPPEMLAKYGLSLTSGPVSASPLNRMDA